MGHKSRSKLPALVLGLLAVLGSGWPAARAQDASRTFPETGKTISGAFLQYWSTHEGLPVLGYPISDVFRETSDLNGQPYIVQYFERAVLESHPENAPPYDILLSQLGTYRYHQKYPQGAPGQHAATGGVVFPATGHTVGPQFLTYWQQHGGLAQYGYPISEEFTEVSDLDGRPYTVQYFERSVLERHPENAPPYDVLLSQLGTFRYRQSYPGGVTPPGATVPDPAAGDWPMYGHDPGRTNYNPDETLITAQNAGRLVARWQAPIGSNGTPPSGAPVVANGRVYAGSSVASGPNLLAFAADSGTPLWGANIGYADSGCNNVGIGATPAVAAGVIVAGGGDAAYYGLNAQSGAQLWRAPLDAGDSGFAWASPLIAAGRAYLGVSSRCDNPSVRGAIRAVDLQNGTLQASQAFVPAGQAGAGIWNSPALSPDGRTLVVATGEDYNGYNGPYNRAIVTLDPLSLVIQQAQRWGATGQDYDWGTTPVVFSLGGRTLIAANHKDGTFLVFDLHNLAAGPVWHRSVGINAGMMPAFDPSGGGTLLFIGDEERLFAVDPLTGATRWRRIIGATYGNMALANGLVFVNTGSQGVQILDEATGALLTSLTPPHLGASFSGVVVAHGVVYWLSGGYLNAWGLPAAGS
ncbi:MAG TPA: PQQ-binding-like beta-propeller repeat protein [Chloroflexia bacterium]|nr:PQQ-binding-like beta-propeller repeat protein [Chloroflexia bacterium]